MKKSDPHSKFMSNCTSKEQHVILQMWKDDYSVDDDDEDEEED